MTTTYKRKSDCYFDVQLYTGVYNFQQSHPLPKKGEGGGRIKEYKHPLIDTGFFRQKIISSMLMLCANPDISTYKVF